jgi:hypothetical protein
MTFSIEILFIITTVFTLWFLLKASGNKAWFLWAPLGWMIILTALSMSGFFENTQTLPPKIVLAPLVPIFIIILMFALPSGRKFILTLDLKLLTWIHLVRIPVEAVLYFLFIQKMVPEIMTFEGSNLDILSGISAPLAAIFLFSKGKVKRYGLMIWNLICLGLLVNIVSIAALSVASPLQQFGFEQPNTAILEFPYVWLPGMVVPIVLFAHLSSLFILLKKPQ